MYLETGNIPIRFIIKSRRLNFLHYILNESDDSLLHQFFTAQKLNPSKGDWISTVIDDLQNLNINHSFEQIKLMSKSAFKELVKKQVKLKSFEYLLSVKETHSKSKDLHYSDFQMQDYLKPGSNMTIRDKCFVFAARSRMLDVNANFKIGKADIICRKCLKHDEDQQHLLSCPELNDNSILLASSNIEYDHLFSNDIKKI